MLLDCGIGEDSWESLDCKEIQQVHPKGNQSWIFIGRTDAETEAPILWPPDKNWPIGKDPDAGKDWRQEEKGTTEDAMVGWYHRLDGHEFEQALGVGDGQGSLSCCSPRGRKESHTAEQLKWTDSSILRQVAAIWWHCIEWMQTWSLFLMGFSLEYTCILVKEEEASFKSCQQFLLIIHGNTMELTLLWGGHHIGFLSQPSETEQFF